MIIQKFSYRPSVGMNNNSSWTLEISQQDLPVVGVLSIEDVEGSFAAVNVVQVLGDPVKGQAFNTFILRC